MSAILAERFWLLARQEGESFGSGPKGPLRVTKLTLTEEGGKSEQGTGAL